MDSKSDFLIFIYLYRVFYHDGSCAKCMRNRLLFRKRWTAKISFDQKIGVIRED